MHEAHVTRATGLIMERLSTVALPTLTLGEFRQLAEAAARDIIGLLAGQTISVQRHDPLHEALTAIAPEYRHVIDGQTGEHYVDRSVERAGTVNGIHIGTVIAAEFLPGMTPGAIEQAYSEFLSDELETPAGTDPAAPKPWKSERE